uniref:Uncharacterized protein n=1 Tax=Rhinopithecus roxellana TaxID=61622 RepID=A0A2K6R9T5_RHIRO
MVQGHYLCQIHCAGCPHSPLRPDCCTQALFQSPPSSPHFTLPEPQSPRRRYCSSSVFLSMSKQISCYRSTEPSSVVGGSRDEMGQEERSPSGW